MGIKWREGTLQIKGRIEDQGARRFGTRNEGRVQRWIKWTYAEVPAAYRALFDAEAGQVRDGIEPEVAILFLPSFDVSSSSMMEQHIHQSIKLIFAYYSTRARTRAMDLNSYESLHRCLAQ